MDAGVRGKGKPRQPHDIPVSAIYVDSSGAGGKSEPTQADIEQSRSDARNARAMPAIGHTWLPDDIYHIIEDTSVILCVDLVIQRNDTAEYLLVKRAQEPLKDEWWVVGGRVHRGETDLQDAARRKAREEIGVDVFNLHPLGYYTEVYWLRNDDGLLYGRHTLSIVFSAEIGETYVKHIKLDETSSDWKFSRELPERFRRNCNLNGKMFL